jgi:hypothetical protein
MQRWPCLLSFFSLILLNSEARSQFLVNRIAATGVPVDVSVLELGQTSTRTMTFRSLSNPIINRDGHVGFAGSIEAAGGSEAGVWLSSLLAPSLQVVAKENSPAHEFFLQGDRAMGAEFGGLAGEESFGPLKLVVCPDGVY